MDITQKKLSELILSELDNPQTIKAIREILGDDALTPQKINNWKHRAMPPAALEGAAIALLSRQGNPSVLRTGLSARSAWHVFYVEDDKTNKEQDVQVWRFWEDVEYNGKGHKTFAHTTLVDQGSCSDPVSTANVEMGVFREEVQSDVNNDTTHSDEEAKKPDIVSLTCQFQIDAGKKSNVGYQLVAQKSMNAVEDSTAGHEKYYEFLGGINVVAVDRSYLIASIPERMISGLFAAWLSFASQVTPVYFITLLSKQADLDGLLDPKSRVRTYFKPWGAYGSMKRWENDVELPEKLLESMPGDWASTWSENGARRVLYAEFKNPPPLTFQSLIYRLPKLDKA